jgi:hypothetical protein
VTRIRLIHTADEFTDLESGALGTVTGKRQDPWGDTVLSIQWDSGSNLSLIEGIDEYELIEEN